MHMFPHLNFLPPCCYIVRILGPPATALPDDQMSVDQVGPTLSLVFYRLYLFDSEGGVEIPLYETYSIRGNVCSITCTSIQLAQLFCTKRVSWDLFVSPATQLMPCIGQESGSHLINGVYSSSLPLALT